MFFNNNKLSFKIILGFSVIITIFTFTTLYTILKLQSIKNYTELLNKGYIPFLKYLSKIQTDIDNDKQLIQKFINDIEFKSSYTKIFKARYKSHPVFNDIKNINQIIESLLNKNTTNLSEKFYNFASKEIIILKNYYEDFLNNCNSFVENEEFKINCEDNINKLTNRMSYLNKKTEKNLTEISFLLQSFISETAIYHILFTLISILIAIIIAIILIITLFPLRTLLNSIKQAKKGDFNHLVEIKSKNEIKDVADAFNEMIEALKNREIQINTQSETLKKHHEEELKIKNKLIEVERLAAIGKLSAQIVHEIRNPLNSITLNTDIIEDEISSNSFNYDEIKYLFKSIKKEIERLTEITESYLQIAKNPKLNRKLQNLNVFFNQFIEFIKPELKSKDITIEYSTNNENLFLNFDENKMRQIFINLIRNSIEAIKEDGLIKINIIDENDIKINISDNGIGIVKDDLKEIFKPFFTTKNYGTGLGLFLVKQIIEEHGGSVFCESDFGKGSIFTIIFEK